MFKQPLKIWQKEDITSTNVYIFAIQTDKTKKYIIMLNAIIKKIFFVRLPQGEPNIEINKGISDLISLFMELQENCITFFRIRYSRTEQNKKNIM